MDDARAHGQRVVARPETIDVSSSRRLSHMLERDEEIATKLGEAGFAVVADYVFEPTWHAFGAEARRLQRAEAFRHAGIGRGASFRVAEDIRNDHVHWIDPARATRRQAAWLARMESLRQVLNRRLWLGLFGFEAHLAVFPPGARYATHLDRFADARHRVVSILLYLNADWTAEDGGALRLQLEPPREPLDVLPAGGTLVAFLSGEIAHEVLPSKRERWSVAGWFTTRP